MNYEKLVREWVKHFGGSIRTDDTNHVVTLPDGMVDEGGETEVRANNWVGMYIFLTSAVFYPATIVGPVPGGAR